MVSSSTTHKIVRSRNLRRNGKCFFIGKAPAAKNNVSGDEGTEKALRLEGNSSSSAETCGELISIIAVLLFRSAGDEQRGGHS